MSQSDPPRVLRKRRIDDIEWECDCLNCGSPLFRGDRVWEAVRGTDVDRWAYCSQSCGTDALQRLQAEDGVAFSVQGGAR